MQRDVLGAGQGIELGAGLALQEAGDGFVGRWMAQMLSVPLRRQARSGAQAGEEASRITAETVQHELQTSVARAVPSSIEHEDAFQ